MPDRDGFEALAQIRSKKALVDISIVAMIASASDAERERYVQAGFDGFLAKPLDSGKPDREIARFAAVPDSTADTRTN
jgi:CheY-like chemotaxis protein